MTRPQPFQFVLASWPVFLGTWAGVCWLLYQWALDHGIWPLVVAAGLFLTAVMNADERVKAYRAWQREWEAMAGLPPPRRKWPQVVAALIAFPVLVLLVYADQHGGSYALLGVLLVLGGPVILLALLVWLCRWFWRLRGRRPGRTRPVIVAIKRPLVPVLSLGAAYLALPDYCQRILSRPRP